MGMINLKIVPLVILFLTNAAYSYSAADHPRSDEIFTQGIISEQDLESLESDMGNISGKLLGQNLSAQDSQYTRSQLIDLYVRLKTIVNQTQSRNILDTRGSDLMQNLYSMIRDFYIKTGVDQNSLISIVSEGDTRLNQVADSMRLSGKNTKASDASSSAGPVAAAGGYAEAGSQPSSSVNADSRKKY